MRSTCVPWNHARMIGPKPPLKPKHIWAIRTRLQHEGRTRDLAMFNVAIDSKLRGCDLVRLRVIRGSRSNDDWLFPSRSRRGNHLTTRQYGRLLDDWVALIGLDPAAYGTHSLRRTKVALLYKRTGNLRACQLLLGHTKLESTVRYLGIEVDDALILSEQTDL
jgi:site-specific recombinase XerD